MVTEQQVAVSSSSRILSHRHPTLDTHLQGPWLPPLSKQLGQMRLLLFKPLFLHEQGLQRDLPAIALEVYASSSCYNPVEGQG